MKTFKYKGYDANLTPRFGTLEAEDMPTAYAALLFQGINVVSLKQQRLGLTQWIFGLITRWRIGGRWTSVFFRELGVMLGSMTLHRALEMLADSSSGNAAEKILRDMAKSVGGGKTLPQALRRHEIIFSDDVIQTIEIADRSGRTQEVAKELSRRLERNYLAQNKVRGALYYPVFVLLAALVAAIVMFNVTLPVFDAFYKNHGAQLPKLTAILFSGGKFLAEHWILILGIFFAAIILIVTIYREVDEVKFFVDKQKLNVRILREITLRNLFGRLSFLIENGITMDEALRLSMLSDENLYLKEMLRGAKISITKGVTLDKILRQVIKKISPLYVGLLSTGEATGEVVEMLRQCEAIADAEIDEILRDLPTKAELYGTILAGLIVAALVFSIMLPILNMSTLNF